jgi:ubiquinone/menaquinone biosynthesis C-methylase UbiE
MAMTQSMDSTYLLGETSTEHERLIRQAHIFAPFTERLFREAGIDTGQRVLDVGSGVGDVALLAARLVGPSGAVVGIERDSNSVATASSRASAAGLANLRFIQGEIGSVTIPESFDAVVGRFIIEFLPDADAVMRSLTCLLRPGGVLAFQDACWGTWLELNKGLALRGKCVSLIREAFASSGAHMDMERVLFQTIQEAGLPSPTMRIEVPIGDDPNIVRYAHDLFSTLLPRMREHGLSLNVVGDLETLDSRLEAERLAARAFASTQALVCAWSRKPA